MIHEHFCTWLLFSTRLLAMKMNSDTRPHSEAPRLGTDVTTVVECVGGSDDCLVQHVLMAAKRKGKSVEWVDHCNALLSVYISCNRRLPSSRVSAAHADSLLHKAKALL